MISEMPDRIPPQKAEVIYPLKWPAGWSVTPAQARHEGRVRHDFVVAREKLEKELQLFSARNIQMTSNVKVDQNGRDMPGMEGMRLTNPGISIFFSKNGKDYVLAYDGWSRPADNMSHMAQHILALRRIEETGGAQLVQKLLEVGEIRPDGEQPAPPPPEPEVTEEIHEEAEVEVVELEPETPWWEILKLDRDAPLEKIIDIYTKERQKAHNKRNVQRIYELDEALHKVKRARGLDE